MVICLNPSKESYSSTNVNNRIRSTECIEEILNNEMEDEAEFLIDIISIALKTAPYIYTKNP